MKSDNTLMLLSFTRKLRLKVRSEADAWLNAAAIEVKWLSGFDLCTLKGVCGDCGNADRVREAGIESARAAA